MLKLKALFGGFVKNYNLNKSYRSTLQIMEYASKLLDENAVVPFVRKGKYDVEEVEVKNEEDLIDAILEALEEYDDENYDNIAIMESSCSSGTPKSTRQLYVFSLKVLPSAE